jgi:hypothetical protein
MYAVSPFTAKTSDRASGSAAAAEGNRKKAQQNKKRIRFKRKPPRICGFYADLQ